MRILAICPSIYPKKLEKMKESFNLTVSSNTDLRVVSEGTVTEAINLAFKEQNDYDFYIVLNDDITFKTPLWDLKLVKKGKITYGTDAIPDGMNGQFLMIDGDIARAIGWLQLPTLNRYCGDVVWRFMANHLDILEYIPEVIIQHNWEGADIDISNEDMGAFAEWLKVSQRDINKIKEILK